MVKKLQVLTTILVFFLGGCAHVISKDVLQQVNRDITYEELQKTPERYDGAMVLLGGVIVKAVNQKAGTLLEVYETRMDRQGRPINLDVSRGRFLAIYDGVLDSEIYQKGRKVTIVGRVEGSRTLKLGEIDYRYPYLVIKDIYLWKKEQPARYEPYPWYPWHPWDPWYHPYWRHRYYH